MSPGDGLTISPLRNLPVIKDLVVDMDLFFDKWVRAEAAHHPTRTAADAIQPVDEQTAERQAANAAIECINCAVCYAACDVVASNPDYLGPAALNRAWSLVNDVRDGGREAILEAVSGTGGCHNCHSQQSCQKYCPNELNPTASIAGLKRESPNMRCAACYRWQVAAKSKKSMISARLYILQRATALIMAPLVIGHIAVMIYAVQNGLSAAEILSRTQGSFSGQRFTGYLRFRWLFMRRLGCAPYCMNGQG